MKKNIDKKSGDILHAINNLLANISLSAQLLVKGVYGPLAAEQKKQLKTIIAQGKTMKQKLKKLS